MSRKLLTEVFKYTATNIFDQKQVFSFITIDDGIRKPLNHLHVGIKKTAGKKLILELLPGDLIEHRGPHYMAPEMKLNDFLGMIIVNYFDDHGNRDKMLRALGV